MDAEDYAEISARLLAALKETLDGLESFVSVEEPEFTACIEEARAVIVDAETRIANDIAEEAEYAAKLAAHRAWRMAEYAERVRLGAIADSDGLCSHD